MDKEYYNKKFVDAIKKSDISIVYEIEVSYFDIDGEDIYFDFEYQIDDRVERLDSDVEDNIKNILGEDYYASVKRLDAFPNGYASYKVTIEK